ncbi:MAG TPA: MarR family transcriptional regulator [Terrimesophilobacter sp.]|nr:MarR family transcriptional regulator [Terrimesophilobacter sp.]
MKESSREPAAGAPGETARSIYDLASSDPDGRLIDRTGVTDNDMREIGAVMNALGKLRDAEKTLSDASLRYMKLNQTDMRALHFLIVCQNRGEVATPGAIAEHLDVSTASVTKLLDRLERGGHITRSPHPTDRRALAITITEKTHAAAMETVGRQQSKRFYAAARLTSQERAIVARFIEDMANEITLRDEPWATPDAHSD